MSKRLILIAVLLIDVLIILVPVSVALVGGHRPNEHLAEDGLSTYFSFFQLLVVAALALIVFHVGRATTPGSSWKGAHLLWLLLGIGFVYLAFDELFMISQSIGDLLNSALDIDRAAIAERTGDIVVGLYGLAGLIVLILFRGELLRHRSALPLLISGIVLMVCTVGLDILGNRSDLLWRLSSSGGTAEEVRCWICAAKDLTTLLSEGLLIGFAYYSLDSARRARRGETDC